MFCDAVKLLLAIYFFDPPENTKNAKKMYKKRNEFISFFTDFYATIWARKVTQEEKIK